MLPSFTLASVATHVAWSVSRLPDVDSTDRDCQLSYSVRVITEIILKGDFHRASFARLPVVGAYEDWKDCVPSSSEDGVADPFRIALNLSPEDKDNKKESQSPCIIYRYIRYACYTQGNHLHKPYYIEKINPTSPSHICPVEPSQANIAKQRAA